MTIGQRPSFDPKSFLAKVGEGGAVGKYGKEQIVFSQGDPADAVFYVRRERRDFPVGDRPTRQLSLRPVAIGAVVEVTKRLKPLV
jgi:hypothetical protein